MISFSSEQWETVYVSFDDAGAVVIAQGKDRIIMDQEQWHKLLAAQQSAQALCPKCGASLSSGTTPKDGKWHCPQCGASG